ncbi:hypothetical protein EDB85DRAFT_1901234 [Lactarius pseudohatsudake]|nr:hypothetical protein EDB85DRAFT_1901234 [Lactarius pseudohatsudake]
MDFSKSMYRRGDAERVPAVPPLPGLRPASPAHPLRIRGGRCDLTLHVRPSPLHAPLGGGTRKPGLGWAHSPSCTPRHARGGRGGVRGAGLASPTLKGPGWVRRPFCVTRRARAQRVRVVTAYLVRTPSDGKGGTGGGVPLCAPFLREWGSVDRGEEGGGRWERRRWSMQGKEGGWVCDLPWCAPHPRERGGVDGGKGEARAYPRAALSMQGGEGRWPALLRPLFNVDGVGEGSGRSGGRGGCPTLLHSQFCANWDGGGIGGMVQQFWTLQRKQNVPATYTDVAGTFWFRHGDHAPSSSLIPALLRATQFAQNWVCKERRTPAPPSTPPTPLTHPIHIKKGTQEGRPMPLSSLHRDGCTRVSPGLSLPPVHTATFARKGGTPCASPFTWKGGARGCTAPVAPALLSPVHAAPFTWKGGTRGYAAPGPSLPIGRGAHKPPGLREGQCAHPGHRRTMPSPGFTHIAPPVHAWGRKRGACKGEGHTHAREG